MMTATVLRVTRRDVQNVGSESAGIATQHRPPLNQDEDDRIKQVRPGHDEDCCDKVARRANQQILSSPFAKNF
jgi:hypothetical protein